MYTAVLRWRGPDPSVELETRHAGFSQPEDAALFANSIPGNSPGCLKLEPNGLRLFLEDGTSKSLTFELVKAWIADLPPCEDVLIADDSDFREFLGSDAHLSARVSAHGEYEIAQFAVLGPDDSPIDVSVSFDDAEHLRVTINESFDEPIEEETTPVLGTLPKA